MEYRGYKNPTKIIVSKTKVWGGTNFICKNGTKLFKFGIKVGFNPLNRKNRYVNCLYYYESDSDKPPIDKNLPISLEGVLINSEFVWQNKMFNDVMIKVLSFTQGEEQEQEIKAPEQEQVVLEEPTSVAPQIEEDDISQWFNKETKENE